ncbi:MAG: cbb3-type cytochrome c oxidase subunit I, partial [Propionicimonas sp.]
MTTSPARVALKEARPTVAQHRWGAVALRLLTTTDHKLIGNMYMVTALAFFALGGVLALVMRAELAFPGLQFVHYETFNQLFTMHGTIMLLMFATPMF